MSKVPMYATGVSSRLRYKDYLYHCDGSWLILILAKNISLSRSMCFSFKHFKRTGHVPSGISLIAHFIAFADIIKV